MPNVYVRALRRAVNLYGGTPRMATLLRTTESQVQAWLYGSEPIPADTFLRVVDLLAAPLGEDSKASTGEVVEPPREPGSSRGPGSQA